ncbi:uncharacterized protein LOC131349288 [Hemibagrus wyckioides]|nr:uncharacterized protein LOC131349288 [Hemibagrus wyckioides]
MGRQSSVYLSALICLLLTMASVFYGAPASLNSTELQTSINKGNTTEPKSESSTVTPSTTSMDLTTAQITTTIKSMSPETRTPMGPVVTVQTQSPNTTSTPGSNSGVRMGVCLIFFFCFLILLLFCFYKWYVRNGRPSCPEIWRRVTEHARNAWATAVTHLRPSSKDEDEEEEDREKEVELKEAEEEKMQGGDDEADDDNSDSSDYSDVGVGGSIKNEENDVQRDESGDDADDDDDDMSSVELKDEKTEKEKDNLTVL